MVMNIVTLQGRTYTLQSVNKGLTYIVSKESIIHNSRRSCIEIDFI